MRSIHCFVCKNCRRTYWTHHADRNQFCSRECAFDAKSAIKEDSHKNCRICNKEIPLRQFYCSDECRKESNRRKNKNRSETKKQKKELMYICKECGRSFVPAYQDKRRHFCSIECCTRNSHRTARVIRRARMHEVKYEPIDFIKILERDKWRCYLCGCQTPRHLRGSIDDIAPEVDHIIPLAKGGPHISENLACICRYHNQIKGDALLKPHASQAETFRAGIYMRARNGVI